MWNAPKHSKRKKTIKVPISKIKELNKKNKYIYTNLSRKTKFIQNRTNMRIKTLHNFLSCLILCCLPFLLTAQRSDNQDVWQDVDEALIPKVGTRYIQPTKYRTIHLNLQALKSILDQAPMQHTPVAKATQTLLELPMPDGSLETFDIVESPIMEPELSEKFPEIMTYAGVSISDPGKFVRFDLTPAGFHAMVLTVGEGTVYIDPYSFGGGDIQNYISYYKKDFVPHASKNFVCGVDGSLINTNNFQQKSASSAFGTCELRTYRLALAATGEYTQFHGGTVAGALAAQVTSMNRVNAVYNRDVGIQMNIIGNNNLIIYTNGATDPYTNNNGGTMLNENQTNIDAVIGSANYDIGHVFSTGGGGIAQLYSPCNNGSKARGVTGSPAPVNDPFDIDYVCHEIGHQFGGNHTQNNNCQRNTGVTSMEPGSASTIMGYAGICPPNVQSNSDDHFHGITLEEIGAFVTSGGHTCPVVTAIPNTAPTITGTNGNVTVPANTPFNLTATATDPDANDVLSYCWEQIDADVSTQPPAATSTQGPNFRSFSPSTSPTRYFPNLNDIIANNTPTWEVLSSVSRTMNFRVSVRDNNTDGGAGCTTHQDVTVTVDGNSGPFLVTDPTATGITWAGLSTETVTWDVAGTDGAPVSCANVDILLSTDGGLTYPTVLASNTPNDGSQAITVPNTASTTARVMVVCSGNAFFDISNNNFTITAATNDYSLTTTNATASVCPPTNATYTIDVGSIGGYSDPVTLSVAGVPAGATSNFGTNPVTPAGTSVLTISNTGAAVAGTYNLTVTANSTSGTKTLPLTLIINDPPPSAVSLITPTNGATNVALPTNFNWTAASGAGVTYDIDIATDAGFVTIVDNATGLGTNNYTSTVLNASTQYFWRVTAANACGAAPVSGTFDFTTGIPGCDTISNYDLVNHNPAVYSAGPGQGYVAGHNAFGDIAKADYFDYTGTNTHITGVFIGFGLSVASNATNTFDVKVWDGTGGTPGAELVSIPITYQAVQTLIAGGGNVGYIPFGNIALPASRDFFVGIEYTYGNDTIALITNTIGETTPATAWEQWGDNTWHAYDEAGSWGIGVAHLIQPVLGTLPTAAFTPTSIASCPGTAVSFTNTSTGAATYEWLFPGGTPATSAVANPTVTYAAAGTYDVTLIATNDCISDTIVVTNAVTVGSPTVTTSSTDASCNGNADGTATAVGAGGTAPYSFAWSSGGTAATETGLGAGTYTVTVTDANGCTATASATVAEPTVLAAMISATTDATCNGSLDGSATVTVSGGTVSYSFTWPSGGTAATETGLAAGTYAVTITDANGCVTTATATINEPAVLATTISSTDESCTGNDGTVTVTTAGGTTPYAFAWSSGGTAATETGLAAGTYTVTVTDANGCVSTNTATVNNGCACTLTAAAAATDASCNGNADGTATATQAGGTAPFTYSWSSGGTAATETGLGTGTYTVTVTDINGCTATASATVNEPTAIVSTGTVVDVDCNGNFTGSIDLTATGGTAPFTYAWDIGPTSEDINGLIAGNYNVTITDANGCTATNSFTVNEPTALATTMSSTDESCTGNDGTATVTTAGGTTPYTFAWSSGGTAATESGLAVGTYTVTVTDANGCVTTNTVAVNDGCVCTLTATAAATDATCNGNTDGTATATAAGGTAPFTYLWSSGGTAATETGLGVGTYDVTVTDANGCTATASATVGEPTALAATISATTDASCNGSTDGSATVTAAGGTATYTFAWDAAAASQTTATANNLGAGTYTVTVTDANGCQTTTTATINEPTAIIGATSSTDETCAGNDGSATVTTSGGTGPYTFLWDAAAASQTTATSINLASGVYNVTITDANGCTNTAAATVANSCTPCTMTAAASVDNNASCNGLNDGQATATTTGGTAPISFQWDAAAGNQTTATATGLTAGVYTVTALDAAGCSASASVTITEPTALSTTMSSTDESCTGNDGTTTVTTAGGTAPFTYIWSSGGTAATESGLTAGSYTVTVTDANGCVTTNTVTVNDGCVCTLSATAAATDATCNGNTDGSATATTAGGTAPFTYIWSSGGTAATESGLGAATYDVTVTDVNGCTATASATVAEPTAIASATTSTAETCTGNDGTATVTATGGTAGYTFLWDAAAGSQTTATAVGLTAGTYIVTITDANGCANTDVATVANSCTPCTMTAAATATDATCNGSADGTATVTTTAGTAPITFVWDDALAQTTATAINLAAGTYTVTATDAAGCTATASVTVNEPTAIASAASSTAETCAGNDGTATVTATGGTAGYTFAWDAAAGSQTTATAVGLTAGTYTVTITDANGCTNTDVATVGNSCAPCTMTATATNLSNASCNGAADGIAIASTTGGTAPITFVWDDALAQTTATANNLAAGAYTVTATDINGCSATASVTITEPVALTAVANTNDESCAGNDGSASVTPSGGTAPYSYLWSNSATTPTISGLVAGNYDVTITDANGCTSINNLIVNNGCVPCALVATATVNNNVSCNGGNDGNASVTTTGGTAPITLSWSNGATTVGISNLAAGTYTVTATDINGCSDTSLVVISEPTAIAATLNATPTTCAANDGDATATVTGGTAPYSFSWSNGGSTATINGLTPGTYDVTITDANACTAVFSTTVSNGCVCAATAAATATDPLCNASCDGTATVTTTNTLAPVTFVWSNGQTTATATGLCAGTYSVTATDANGCVATTSISVVNPAAISISGTATNETCEGADGGATANVSGGVAPYSYAWSNGGNAQTIINVAQGVYTVTVTDANGCTGNGVVTVGFNNTLSTNAVASQNASCAGYNDGEGQAVGIGVSNISYQWSNGATTQVATGLAAGVHTVTITGGICSTVRSITVTEPSAMNLSLATTSTPCVPGTGQIAANVNGGGGAPYTYQWNTGASSSVISNLQNGAYTVTVTDANGCMTVSNASINVAQGPIISSTNTPPTCSGSGDGSIDLSVTPAGGNYSFNWNNGATTEDIVGINGGIWTVQVTDASTGCVVNYSDTVVGPAPIVAVFSTTEPNTQTSSDGAITVLANNGTAPYSYLWNTGDTTDALLGIGVGTYSVTITDANGCTAVDTVVLGAFTSVVDVEDLIDEFVIMPNPNNGQFNVRIELSDVQDINLRMTDVLGRTIMTQELSGKSWLIPMDWDRLAGGTYFITLSSSKTSKTQKVIIAK
jgi:hypothetical protein